MLIPSGPMAVDKLANRITSFLSAALINGVYVNGSCWNCRLSSPFDIWPARHIAGGMN